MSDVDGWYISDDDFRAFAALNASKNVSKAKAYDATYSLMNLMLLLLLEHMP